MQSNSWLVRKTSPQRRLRLYCFSYAGGSAYNYSSWQDQVDPGIEICAVQLPGRGARFGEVPFTSMHELVKTLAAVIAGQDRLPFAFFGHSLGGLLAFELARYCRRLGWATPRHLFASGSEAPGLRRSLEQFRNLDDDAMLQKLRQYNGTPPEVLQNEELMRLVLPTIRADFALVDDYRYVKDAPLNVDITVLTGRGDDHVSDECFNGWRRETDKACAQRWFDGDHFFINSHRAEVVASVGDICRTLL